MINTPMILELTKTAKRILYISPIKSNDLTNVETITEIEGSLLVDVKYSFSYDDVNWSTYQDKNDFLATIESDETYSLTTYVRLFVETYQNPNMSYSTSTYNFVGIMSVLLNGVPHECCGMEYADEVVTIRSNPNSNGLNPYRGLDKIHDIRLQLANSVTNTLGLESVYFKNTPDESTKSILFKSYKVFKSQEPKEIKVVLNQDDDNNQEIVSYQYHANIENVEIEIDKLEWERVYGEQIPNTKDSIYIKMYDRMYRVAQVRDERNFVNESVSWKFYLGFFQEGVEVDTKDSKEEIDDFTEFLAYDIENTDHARDEIEQATGTHDSVEETFIDSDTKYTNEHSTLIDYQKGMYLVETGLVLNGVEFQRRMYHNDTDVPYLASYDVSKHTLNKYATSLWFSTESVGKSLKLSYLGDDRGSYNEQVYINSHGMLALHISGTINKYITALGTPIIENENYGVVFSRFGEMVILSLLQIVDSEIKEIQKIVGNSDIPKQSTVLTINGDSRAYIGNVRYLKKSITNATLIPFVTNWSPTVSDHLVIDNCEQTTTGIYVKTKS